MRTRLLHPAPVVFGWHERPGALSRLTPPWQDVEVLQAPASLADGTVARLRMRVGPVRRLWVAEHRGYRAGEEFQDVQRQGPFRRWVHTHRVRAEGQGACTLEDHIEYALPMGWLGRALGGAHVRRELRRAFRYRHDTTAADLAAHASAPTRAPLRVLITGASGLVGSALAGFLRTGGHEVRTLSRSGEGIQRFDPATGTLDAQALDGVDAVVHLAGENIGQGRWTRKKKARVLDSRVKGTRLLAQALAGRSAKPPVWISASAVGIYGDRGAEVLDETSAQGEGFLAEVCRAWEAATEPARDAGVRTVHLRLGVVLSPRGGALRRLLTPFKLGLGGRLGNGRQWMSWISLDDAVGAIHHAIQHDTLAGPVNAVAPTPLTNAEFTRALGRVLRRWTVLPVPAMVARVAFGQMAKDVLLAGQRALPARLVDSGYTFRHPTIQDALRHLLGRQVE